MKQKLLFLYPVHVQLCMIENNAILRSVSRMYMHSRPQTCFIFSYETSRILQCICTCKFIHCNWLKATHCKSIEAENFLTQCINKCSLHKRIRKCSLLISLSTVHVHVQGHWPIAHLHFTSNWTVMIRNPILI